MSFGASSAKSGYFELAASIISVINGKLIASQYCGAKQLQINPPALSLIVATDFGVTNSEAIIMSTSPSLSSSS